MATSATCGIGPVSTLVSVFASLPAPTLILWVRRFSTCSSTNFMPASTASAAARCRSGEYSRHAERLDHALAERAQCHAEFHRPVGQPPGHPNRHYHGHQRTAGLFGDRKSVV